MQDDGKRSSGGGIVAGLMRGVSGLVRAEISLATTEMTQNATAAGRDIGSVAVGGAIAFAGFLVLLAAATRILEAILPRWLAALIVGSATVGGGAILVQRGLQELKESDLVPEKTIDTLKKLGE